MWRILLLAVALTVASAPALAGVPDAAYDPTIRNALRLLGLARSEWPEVVLVAPGQFVDAHKDLESFAAFRVRRGSEVDPTIYINPRHRFYREARGCGSDLYPLFRLASLLRHELQHAQADHGEATALEVQAAFLRRVLILLPGRRGDALAYIQALEGQVAAARRWDAAGVYPAREVN